MTDFTQLHCQPVSKSDSPMSDVDVKQALTQIKGWTLSENGKTIHLARKFTNYYETVSFVNAVAWIAHSEDHHPDITFGYNRCEIVFSTHAVNGLTINDFICASRINALVNNE